MQSPTNLPTASASLAIIATNVPALSFAVSSSASPDLKGEVLLKMSWRRDRVIDSQRPALLIFKIYLEATDAECRNQISPAQPKQSLGFLAPGEGIYNMALQFERRHRHHGSDDRQDDQDNLS
jgi:hypothetical protein